MKLSELVNHCDDPSKSGAINRPCVLPPWLLVTASWRLRSEGVLPNKVTHPVNSLIININPSCQSGDKPCFVDSESVCVFVWEGGGHPLENLVCCIFLRCKRRLNKMRHYWVIFWWWYVIKHHTCSFANARSLTRSTPYYRFSLSSLLLKEAETRSLYRNNSLSCSNGWGIHCQTVTQFRIWIFIKG